MVGNGDQAVSDIGRHGDRNKNTQQDLQRIRTLESRRLFQFLGNALEGLAKQENTEGGCQIWQ